MNGVTKYNNYLEAMENMNGPYTSDDIPNIQLDLRGMVSYAKQHGKAVPDLTDSELAPYVLNATVNELRNAKIYC